MARNSPSLVVRALWFVFVGWWLTGLWLGAAWLLNVTIIGLPLGIWMINRTPKVLTLKGREVGLATSESSPHVLIRAVYFVLVGWWLSALWTAVAWLLSLTVVGIPLSVLMLHALPTVTSLHDY